MFRQALWRGGDDGTVLYLAAKAKVLWGLLRHQWGAVHTWIAVVLLAVLAVHVALHWRWLVNGLSTRSGVRVWAERSPRLAGVALLAAAVLPLTILAVAAHLSARRTLLQLHQITRQPPREVRLRLVDVDGPRHAAR